MNRLRIFTLAFGLAVAAASCSQTQGPSIVGKWARGNDVTFTFTKDGQMIKEEGTGRETMGYSISDGTNLYLKPKDLPMSIGYAISFPSENEMVLTMKPPDRAGITPPQDNESMHFTRVRE